IEQFVPAHAVKTGNVSQNSRQSTHAQRVVIRNRDMVLRWIGCGQQEMCPGLPGDLAAQSRERVGKLLSGQVAREFHRVRTSSRTKWRRMILGALSSSK